MTIGGIFVGGIVGARGWSLAVTEGGEALFEESGQAGIVGVAEELAEGGPLRVFVEAEADLLWGSYVGDERLRGVHGRGEAVDTEGAGAVEAVEVTEDGGHDEEAAEDLLGRAVAEAVVAELGEAHEVGGGVDEVCAVGGVDGLLDGADDGVVLARPAARGARAMPVSPGSAEASDPIDEGCRGLFGGKAAAIVAVEVGLAVREALSLAGEGELLELLFEIEEGSPDGFDGGEVTAGGELHEVHQVEGVVGEVGRLPEGHASALGEVGAGAAEVVDPGGHGRQGREPSEDAEGDAVNLDQGDGELPKGLVVGEDVEGDQETVDFSRG